MCSSEVQFPKHGVKLKALLDFLHSHTHSHTPSLTHSLTHLYTCSEIQDPHSGEWEPNYWSEGRSEVRKTLAHMSTKDVCEVILKPLLRESRVSYCEYLLLQQQQQQQQQQQDEQPPQQQGSVGVSGSSATSGSGSSSGSSSSSSSGSSDSSGGSGSGGSGSSDLVGIATLFVSHAWKYKFLDVVNALARHLKDEPDTFIWFDLFSNNQWDAPALSFDWWCDTFKNAIQSIGRVVMVLTPWSNPIPFTRSWCLFELYCTIVTKSKFEVAMSESEEESFVRDIIDEENESSVSYLTMLGNINVELSEAWDAEDKKRILAFVTGLPGGAEAVNTMCCERLRDYMLHMISKDRDDDTGAVVVTPDMRQFNLRRKRAKGNLLRQQNKFDEALCVLEEVLHDHEEADEINSLDAANVLQALGSLYTDRGMYVNAKTFLQKSRVVKEQILGENHIEVASVLLKIACVHDILGECRAALQLYEQCLSIFHSSHVNPTSDKWSDLYYSFALVYVKQSCYPTALEYFEKSLDIVLKNRGPKHPNVGDVYKGMAQAHQSQGNIVLALELNKKSLEVYQQTLGPWHANVGTAHHEVACVFHSLNNFNKSMEHYNECVTVYQRILKETHPFFAAVYYNMARATFELGQLTISEEYHMRTLDILSETLGSKHPNVGHTYVSLGRVHERQEGGVAKAKFCYEKSLEVYAQGEHPTGEADAYCSLALLSEKEGNFTESMRFYQRSLDIYTNCLGTEHNFAAIVRNHVARVGECIVRERDQVPEQL